MLRFHEVPAYAKNELAAKQNDFCVCVFVINEGERLLRQLEVMQPICKGVADVVVADGGSSDGSTEVRRLCQLGVNTLLTKTGSGRLGSQMRMAFDWALSRGYAGVVVVDGNGKDGIEAVPRFVCELRSGADHVQGSRFLQGGHHANTPLSRLLGVRFLHAPLMSIAARFRYTDTTNGFRGYSRRLLESEELEIFRNCFCGYEFHYYLAIEAARCGFVCREIPVSRVYPKGVPPPTKIKPFSGNLRVLRELFKCCLRRYRPLKCF